MITVCIVFTACQVFIVYCKQSFIDNLSCAYSLCRMQEEVKSKRAKWSRHTHRKSGYECLGRELATVDQCYLHAKQSLVACVYTALLTQLLLYWLLFTFSSSITQLFPLLFFLVFCNPAWIICCMAIFFLIYSFWFVFDVEAVNYFQGIFLLPGILTYDQLCSLS